MARWIDPETHDDALAELERVTTERDQARQVKEHLEATRVDPDTHKAILEANTAQATRIRQLEDLADRLCFERDQSRKEVAAVEAACRCLSAEARAPADGSELEGPEYWSGLDDAACHILRALKKARGE